MTGTSVPSSCLASVQHKFMTERYILDGGCDNSSVSSGWSSYSDETPVFSDEGKLLVQIGHDVFVSVQEERDVGCLSRTLPRLEPFSRIHLEVRHSGGLRALSNAIESGALAQEEVAKIRVLKLDITATLGSTLADLAIIFRSLTHVRDVHLFLPELPVRSFYLPHKQTVHSLIAESSVIRSLSGPAPPLYCLSLTIHLEQDDIYSQISRLFHHSLTKLRILRRQEPGATFTFTKPSPARACVLLDLVHLEYLEIRDLTTFSDSGLLGEADTVSTLRWMAAAVKCCLPKLTTLVWAPPWYNFYDYAPEKYTETVATYQYDLAGVLGFVTLVMCVSRAEGIVFHPYLDGTHYRAEMERVFLDEDEWRL